MALHALAICALVPAAFAQEKGESAIKDDGGMFGVEAVRAASDVLRREARVPVVIETVNSIKEFGIVELAERRHEQKYPNAVYVLMASREHKISSVLVPEDLAARIPEKDRQAVRDAFLDGFKRKAYDEGLAQGVRAIESMIAKLDDGGAPASPRVAVGHSPLIRRNQARLTLEGARVALAAAEAKAVELHVSENLAVVDEGGHLLAFARMDGARPASVATATTKAQAAATFRQPTGPVPSGAEKPDPLLNVGMQLAAIQGDGKFTTLLGGLPIVVDGQVVGALGVGGGTGEQDVEVARAGVAALVEALKAPTSDKPPAEAVEKAKAEPDLEKKPADPLDALREGSKPERPQ